MMTMKEKLIDFPAVVQELKPIASREEIRYAIGETGSFRITDPLKIGSYILLNREQVELLKDYFFNKSKGAKNE